MSIPDEDPVSQLVALANAVDESFAGVQARQTTRMMCKAGCSNCCRARLSITRVEEALFRRGLARVSETARNELARRAQDPHREMCPALDTEGQCQLYEWRPLICRSFGVPLRHRADVILVNPPVVDVCDLNFVDVPLVSLPSEDVLEQTELDHQLTALDDAYCDRNEHPRGVRIGIAQILASPDSDV